MDVAAVCRAIIAVMLQTEAMSMAQVHFLFHVLIATERAR